MSSRIWALTFVKYVSMVVGRPILCGRGGSKNHMHYQLHYQLHYSLHYRLHYRPIVQNGTILVPIQSTDLSRIAGVLWFFNLSITLSIPFKSRLPVPSTLYLGSLRGRCSGRDSASYQLPSCNSSFSSGIIHTL